jgi:hypothetical protein
LHHRLTACRRFLAWALDGNGKSNQAEPILGQVVANFDKTLGPGSKFTIIAGYELAFAAMHAGHAAAAVDAARRAVQNMQSGDVDAGDQWTAQLALADALAHANQAEEGIALGRQTLAAAMTKIGADDPKMLGLRTYLSDAYRAAGMPVAAESLLRENLQTAGQLRNRPAWLEAQIETQLAEVLAAENRRDEAGQLVTRALPILSGTLGPDNQRTVGARRQFSALTAGQ